MGRRSKLTDKQWLDVERRALVEGESVSALAREYRIDEAAIRRRINPKKSASKSLMELAKEKVMADKQVRNISARISELPMSRQQIVSDLVHKLSSISNHLASAAEYGAMDAHRLSGIAHGLVERIDDVDPTSSESLETLKGIAVLTKMACASSEIGLNLLAANRDAIKSMNAGDNASRADLLKEIATALPD